MFKSLKSKLALAGAAVFGSMLASTAAHADILTDVNTAITAAKGDALTVGGYVVAAIAALIVVTLIIGMVRKL